MRRRTVAGGAAGFDPEEAFEEAAPPAVAAVEPLRTEFEFELPRGYVDAGARCTGTARCGWRPRATS